MEKKRPYEVETILQFKILYFTAVVSIDYILEPVEEIMGRFENKVQYYRYYVDNLFFFLGLINDRFFCKPNNRDTDLQERKEERIALNRRNYQFLEHDFDILSNKMPRNIIEHLDRAECKNNDGK